VTPISATAVPTHFIITEEGAASVGTGQVVNYTVIPEDANNNVVFGFSGAVHFSSSDLLANLPADQPLPAAGPGGLPSFPISFLTPSTTGQTITVTATAAALVSGTSAPLPVTQPGPLDHFRVTGPATAVQGVPVLVTVVAEDADNNVVTSYTGTVTLSSDQSTDLPENYTFTSSDHGMHVFSNVILNAANVPTTIEALDIVSSPSEVPISGSTGPILVTTPGPGQATHLELDTPLVVSVPTSFDVTVKALDAHGNIVPDYTGTVQLNVTGTASGSVQSTSYTFTAQDAGVHTFVDGATPQAGPGNLVITASDTGSGISGVSPSITVNASAVNMASVPNAVTGTPLTVQSVTNFAKITNVEPIPDPDPADTPSGITFPVGFVDFMVQNVPR
jgi:hypothetical protein